MRTHPTPLPHALLASLLVACTGAVAQEQSPYSIGLRQTFSHDSNVYRQSNAPVSETIARTGVRLGLNQRISRQRLSLSADADINRVTAGPDAPGWEPHEALLLRAADELHATAIEERTWDDLEQRYSTEQIMDIVFTVGQYNLVSWALNSFGVPLDDFLPGAQKK